MSDFPISVEMDYAPTGKSALDFEKAKELVLKEMERLPPNRRPIVAKKLILQFEAEQREHEGRHAALTNALTWLTDLSNRNGELRLEKNDCSRLHKLKQAAKDRHLFSAENGKEIEVIDASTIESIQHTFVVKHDWASAFKDAEGLDAEIRFPYELCTFEFRFSGKTMICLCAGYEGTAMFTAFLELGDHWLSLSGKEENSDWWKEFCWSQIKAICIALDAEVATETVVRAPHKLNEKRIKAGHVPLPDFRVVDLAKRHRISNPLPSQSSGSKKRLHFRRGHWRHFEESKTWVRWCLVGDPDLGFISKQYSL